MYFFKRHSLLLLLFANLTNMDSWLRRKVTVVPPPGSIPGMLGKLTACVTVWGGSNPQVAQWVR